MLQKNVWESLNLVNAFGGVNSSHFGLVLFISNVQNRNFRMLQRALLCYKVLCYNKNRHWSISMWLPPKYKIEIFFFFNMHIPLEPIENFNC